ncbi:uncharacterized protein [Henckelia pumila]|uniref:uncharacterized protein n=1 Tax=Henckelia pumila TaxID=405737 RepID=UPI003C6E0D4F
MSLADNVAAAICDRRFQYEALWSWELDCEEVVREGWTGHGNVQLVLHDRIRNCAEFLRIWERDMFRSLPRKIKKKREELEQIRIQERWSSEFDRIMELERDIEKLSSQEEIYSRQRSRADWFALGDKNTKNFQIKATMRKAQNQICGLMSSHGDFV